MRNSLDKEIKILARLAKGGKVKASTGNLEVDFAEAMRDYLTKQESKILKEVESVFYKQFGDVKIGTRNYDIAVNEDTGIYGNDSTVLTIYASIASKDKKDIDFLDESGVRNEQISLTKDLKIGKDFPAIIKEIKNAEKYARKEVGGYEINWNMSLPKSKASAYISKNGALVFPQFNIVFFEE